MANDIQQLTFSAVPSAGTWTITFAGVTGAALNYDASTSDLAAALAGMPLVGSTANVSVGGDYTGGFTIAFQGALADFNWPQVSVDASGLSVDGGSLAVSETQAGTAGNGQELTISGPNYTFVLALGVEDESGGNYFRYQCTVVSGDTSAANNGDTVSVFLGGNNMGTWIAGGNAADDGVVDYDGHVAINYLDSSGTDRSTAMGPALSAAAPVTEEQQIDLPTGTFINWTLMLPDSTVLSGLSPTVTAADLQAAIVANSSYASAIVSGGSPSWVIDYGVQSTLALASGSAFATVSSNVTTLQDGSPAGGGGPIGSSVIKSARASV